MNALLAFLYEHSPWDSFWSAWLVGFCFVGADGQVYLTQSGEDYLAVLA